MSWWRPTARSGSPTRPWDYACPRKAVRRTPSPAFRCPGPPSCCASTSRPARFSQRCDKDRIYLSLQEFNAVGRRNPDGTIEVLASDPRLIWADTFWITPDRWLYISSSQVNRRAAYNEGVDGVKPPFAVLRMRIDAGPV